jgi:hypothetical protein
MKKKIPLQTPLLYHIDLFGQTEMPPTWAALPTRGTNNEIKN